MNVTVSPRARRPADVVEPGRGDRWWSSSRGSVPCVPSGPTCSRSATWNSGPPGGQAVLLLHGFPYDVHSYVDVAPRLAAAGCRVIVPTCAATARPASSTRDAAVGSAGRARRRRRRPAWTPSTSSARPCRYDWGGRAACVVAALWPERCAGLVSVNGYLVQDIAAAATRSARTSRRASGTSTTSPPNAAGRPHREPARDRPGHLAPQLAAWPFDDATLDRAAEPSTTPTTSRSSCTPTGTASASPTATPPYAELEERARRVSRRSPSRRSLSTASPTATSLPRTGPRPPLTSPGRVATTRYRVAGHNLPQEAPGRLHGGRPRGPRAGSRRAGLTAPAGDDRLADRE